MQEMQNEAECLAQTPPQPSLAFPQHAGPGRSSAAREAAASPMLPARKADPQGGASCGWGRTRGHPTAGHRQRAGGEGGGVSHASQPRGAEIRGVRCSSVDMCCGAGNAQNRTFAL